MCEPRHIAATRGDDRLFELAMGNENDRITRELAHNLSEVTERLDTITAQLYQKAQTYNNAVVVIGYASFFAIWAFSRIYLPETTSIHVALAMGLSIFLFVIFVVIDMSYHTFVVMKANAKLRHKYEATTLEGLIAESKAHKAMTDDFSQSVMRGGLVMLVAWPFFFFPSLLSGVYAALLLLYNFAAHLLEWLPYWPK